MSEENVNEDRTPWVKVKVNITKHRKTLKLARMLDIERQTAVGILIDLFAQTYMNVWQTGDWDGWEPGDVEFSLGWNGESGLLLKALRDCGWLDGTVVHDWTTTQARQIARRANREGMPPPPPQHHSSAKPTHNAGDPNAARAKTARLMKERGH